MNNHTYITLTESIPLPPFYIYMCDKKGVIMIIWIGVITGQDYIRTQ